MNIVLENKFEKLNRTLILLILISIMSYSLYNIFNYTTTTYYQPAKEIYIIEPVMKMSADTVYPLTDPVIIN